MADGLLAAFHHRPPPFRGTVGTKQTTEAEVGGLDTIGPARRPENCQDNPQVFGELDESWGDDRLFQKVDPQKCKIWRL